MEKIFRELCASADYYIGFSRKAGLGKFFSKLIWVFEHFLTMECYRKLCSRLYWKKLQPGTASYKTRCWLIFLSVISACWLAFFYDPTDPANLNSPSKVLSFFSKLFKKIDHTLHNCFSFLCPAEMRFIAAAADNISARETFLKVSALRI